MNLLKRFIPALVILALFVCSCSKDNSTESKSEPVGGTITATATGITGQNGSVLAVAAYDTDWYPGSTSPTIAGYMVNITSDNFSFSQNLHPVDSQNAGGYLSEDMVFEPETYSVVFYVAAPENPPEYFFEVRVTVDGNVTAVAASWNAWTQAP